MTDIVIQVRQRRVVTLPAGLPGEVRASGRRYISSGRSRWGLVLTRRVSLVPELAWEIERLRMEAGVTTVGLLDGLREQRERYPTEAYAAEQ